MFAYSKKNRSLIWFAVVTWMLVAIHSCSLDDHVNPDPVTWDRCVKAGLKANCTVCHSKGSDNGDWTDSTEVKANIDDIIRKIKEGKMPPPNGLAEPKRTELLNCLESWQKGGFKMSK